MSVYPNQVWYKMLRNGASPNMNIDGSVSPVHFDVPYGAGPTTIHRVNFSIIDGAITPAKFGGITTLTNGILIRVVDALDNVVVDFLDGVPIKRNGDWGFLAGGDNVTHPAAGDDHLPVRWTLTRGLGDGLELLSGQKLRVTIQDDLSGISIFCAMAQGVYNKEPV